MSYQNIQELLHKTITDIKINKDEVHITLKDSKYVLRHIQDCCENVVIYDVIGNPEDLLNTPLIMVQESVDSEWPEDVAKPEYVDSYTWSLYRFLTINGGLNIRWLGESNGYYSETVSIIEVESPPDIPLINKGVCS